MESKIAELPEPLAATLALTNQQCPPLAQVRQGPLLLLCRAAGLVLVLLHSLAGWVAGRREGSLLCCCAACKLSTELFLLPFPLTCAPSRPTCLSHLAHSHTPSHFTGTAAPTAHFASSPPQAPHLCTTPSTPHCPT